MFYVYFIISGLIALQLLFVIIIMNVNYIYSATEYMGYSGRIFSNEQCVMLRNSLTVIQKENKLHQMFLWGQICGTEKDYIISFGHRKDVLQDLVYYYSTDYINWVLMPTGINKRIVSLTEACHTRFQGDPKYSVDVYKEEQPQQQQQQQPVKETEVSETTNPVQDETKMLKEEDRVAATVQLVTKDTAIIPRGALFKTAEGIVIQNATFQGLKSSEATDLKSYLHFREPEHRWNTNLLTRQDYNYALDFLDSVDMDTPEGKWSTHLVTGEQLVILRNLEWTGMTFYHKIGTPQHWYIYLGNGKKNLDIPFMI